MNIWIGHSESLDWGFFPLDIQNTETEVHCHDWTPQKHSPKQHLGWHLGFGMTGCLGLESVTINDFLEKIGGYLGIPNSQLLQILQVHI